MIISLTDRKEETVPFKGRRDSWFTAPRISQSQAAHGVCYRKSLASSSMYFCRTAFPAYVLYNCIPSFAHLKSRKVSSASSFRRDHKPKSLFMGATISSSQRCIQLLEQVGLSADHDPDGRIYSLARIECGQRVDFPFLVTTRKWMGQVSFRDWNPWTLERHKNPRRLCSS